MRGYRKILVAVDGSPAAGKGLREATRLAQQIHAQLVILHVDEYAYLASGGDSGLIADVPAQLRKVDRHILDKAQALARRQEVEAKTVLAAQGGARCKPRLDL